MEPIIVQYFLVGALFLVALGYMIQRTRRSLKGGKSCSKGCGCAFTDQHKPMNT